MKQSSLLICLSAGLCQLASASPAVELNNARDVSRIQSGMVSNAIEHESLEARQTDCRRGLSCSYDYIESQPMDWRYGYLRTIQNNYLTQYNSGSQFRNIEGQISLLIELRLGAPKTYYSCQNAGLIEAIQNAAAIVVGIGTRDGGNPGVRPWVNFFRRMRSGGYSDRNQHDNDWSQCEETSSEYGRTIATRRRYRPTQREATCYKTDQSYRYAMRNKTQSSSVLRIALNLNLGGLLNAVTNLLSTVTGVLNFSTDVTSSKAGYGYYKSGQQYLNSGDNDDTEPEVLSKISPGLYQAYRS